MKKIVLTISVVLLTTAFAFAQVAPVKYGPTPNERQMKYLQEPMAAFIHFGMNTFAGSDGIEWGNDTKRPASTFNPTNGEVDTDQWVRLLQKAGFTRVIITLKHHDGFCTWPTKVTDYNISKSPYLDGKGDLAKQLSESCDKYGMDMGIYLSPWDAWEPSYGDASEGDYNDFYDNQLRELLGGEYGRLNPETGKREIIEIWLDGATGAGTAHQTYDFTRYVNTVRELQPNCLTWMTLAAAKNYSGDEANFPVDAFWVGNEKGYVNDPVWVKVNVNGSSVSQYSNTGNYISIPEADVSIRPGWFYHSSQDGSVKSLDYLMHNIYMRTVGMGIPLLLNVPPARDGRFHANDSIALEKFGNAIAKTFETNLLNTDMNVSATANRGAGFEVSNILDNDYDTYWTMADGQTTGSITIDLGKDTELDVIRFQEYLPLGQRISSWNLEVEVYGVWREYGSGKTVGYQRMVKGEVLPVRKIRLSITSSLAVPIISGVQAYRSDASVANLGPIPAGLGSIDATDIQSVETKKVSKLKFEVLEMPSGNWPTLAEMKFFTTTNGVRTELDRTGFTATATSEAKKAVNGEPDCLASNTIDGNNSTIWQPEWKPKVAMPQSLMYDFGKQVDLTEISYLQRQSTLNDIASKFNIYIAENADDEYTLSIAGGTFVAGLNKAQYAPVATGWVVMQDYSDLGSAIQSTTDKAEAKFDITEGWFRIIGAKSPSSGIMEVWIDGVKEATIDTYASSLTKDVALYENTLSKAGNHTVLIKATGDKNEKSLDSKITLQKVVRLEDNIKGMFEINKSFVETTEDAKVLSFEIHRFGDLSETASVTYITSPGTGVHGKTYTDKSEVVTFGVGESKKILTVEILENDLAEGNKDFYIELNNPASHYVLGFVSVMRVLVYDNDGDAGNPNLEGYCTPEGTQHSGKKAYLESASTEGAKKDLLYEATKCPDNVYVKCADSYVEAERNSTFTLNLKAFEAGERSTSVVYQDFRYNRAYIYVDWNADLAFADNEKIAEYGIKPTNNVLGNYDEVMDISLDITVPESTILQSIPIRVLYHNAWQNLSNGACSNVTEGMAYDFRLKVLPSTVAIESIKNMSQQFNVFRSGDNIICSGDMAKVKKVDLINLNGVALKSMHSLKPNDDLHISMSNLQKGFYLVAVSTVENTEVHKIIY